MIMPQVTIPAGGADLTFWQYQNFDSYYIYHGIWVSTASDDPADFTELVELGVGTEDTWEEVTLDLSAYAGQSIYIAFRYEGDWADEWYVDDASVSYEMQAVVPVYTFNTTTDADGMYSYWMPAGSYTVTVTAADHVGDFATVAVPAAGAAAQDFSLQWIGPCVTSIEPSAMGVTVAMGRSTTLPARRPLIPTPYSLLPYPFSLLPVSPGSRWTNTTTTRFASSPSLSPPCRHLP